MKTHWWDSLRKFTSKLSYDIHYDCTRNWKIAAANFFDCCCSWTWQKNSCCHRLDSNEFDFYSWPVTMRVVTHNIYKASKISLCITHTRDWYYTELAHFLPQVEPPAKAKQSKAMPSNQIHYRSTFGYRRGLLNKIVNMLSWNKNNSCCWWLWAKINIKVEKNKTINCQTVIRMHIYHFSFQNRHFFRTVCHSIGFVMIFNGWFMCAICVFVFLLCMCVWQVRIQLFIIIVQNLSKYRNCL